MRALVPTICGLLVVLEGRHLVNLQPEHAVLVGVAESHLRVSISTTRSLLVVLERLRAVLLLPPLAKVVSNSDEALRVLVSTVRGLLVVLERRLLIFLQAEVSKLVSAADCVLRVGIIIFIGLLFEVHVLVRIPSMVIRALRFKFCFFYLSILATDLLRQCGRRHCINVCIVAEELHCPFPVFCGALHPCCRTRILHRLLCFLLAGLTAKFVRAAFCIASLALCSVHSIWC